MDKNTLIGLGLIGAILVTFTYLNKPSDAEMKAQELKAKKEQVVSEKLKQVSSLKKVAKKNVSKGSDIIQSNDIKEVECSSVILKNNKLTLNINTKGANLNTVELNTHKTYHQFASKKKTSASLVFFKEKNATNILKFNLDGKPYSTENEIFTIKKQTSKKLILETSPAKDKTIQFIYTLKKNAYDFDFEVKFNGFGNEIAQNSIFLDVTASLAKTERLLGEQRKVSTICFKNKDKEYDYLSEMSNDEEIMESPLEWVAFKQSYFSSILKPETNFNASGSSLKIINYPEGHSKYHTNIKKYNAILNLSVPNTQSGTFKMNWFFGPNDYELLGSYKSNYEDIINYGWGLFRWINIYAIQPMFNAFAGWGISLGIVILLITLVIKLVLTPIQWKMYVSSAKMRILKPEIDELNAKFPKKEDAMKKQMEMMSLYKESGASPLAGCIPMLIQMPILLAIFRFFPAAFELRQKPFLWAEDLSSFDSIYQLSFYIPFYGDHISLFTLLMSVTTLVYTYINSSNVSQPQQPGMPDMKVIMYIFPFMMIFFFNNYSAGLSYYYFISTLISILIMIAIKAFFVDEEKLKQKMAEKKVKASTTVKKKSKFQERLESMQKMQQEKLKKK
jgi:YidC/Oxa1 family membrane protein insertase